MKSLKKIPFFPFTKGNIIAVLIVITLVLFLIPKICFAEVWLSDNFNVSSGGGDLNYDIGGGRQSGIYAPYLYNISGELPTVTNAGIYAGKCKMDGVGSVDPIPGSWVGFSDNMIDSHSYTVEYELNHYSGGPGQWFGMDIGKDIVTLPNDGVGMGLEFFNDGSYLFFVYTNTMASFPAATLTYPVKIKVCVKQAGVGQDALISMFVNDNAFPVEQPFNKAVYTYPNGFTNNIMTWGSLTPAQATMDNFLIGSAENTVAQVSSWTGDADSGISSTKIYTHAVNLNLENTVTVNDVLFEGVGTATSGANWMLRTAPGNSFANTFMNDLGIDVNLSGSSFSLGTGAVYSTTHCSTLTLTNLNTKILYRLTLYGCGYDVSSKAYLSALDGGGKSAQISMAANGLGNGQKISYDYMSDAEGVFSFAASSIPGLSTNEWYWFAFSNEIIVPDSPAGLTASEGEYTDKVALGWDEVKGTEYYSIFRNTVNDSGTATDISGQILLNSYDDTSAVFGQHYYYWVRACNTAGCSALSTVAFGYTKSEFPPEKPVNLSPINLNVVTSPVTFTASGYTDPGSYSFSKSQWQVSTNSGFSSIDWDSGETIPLDSITPPASLIQEATNYWRVRYKNDRNTWSDLSEGTSFILVKGETQSGIFLDTFNVSGSGNVNHEYSAASRQYGSATPLTYTLSGQTEIGSTSENPGKLLLGLNSGCAPDCSFTESSEYIIEFDAESHNYDGSSDWVSLCFGKYDNSDLFPISFSGAGLVFFANGQFSAFNSTSLIASAVGVPTGEKIHVTLVASTEDFDYSPVQYAAFVNGIPMLISTNNSNFIYEDYGGFSENFISIFSFNSTSPNSSLIDNLKVSKAMTNEVRVSRWINDATSLIDDQKDYTHAVNLNGDPISDFNGVDFEGTGNHPDSYLNGNSMIKTNEWEMSGAAGGIYFAGTYETPLSNIVENTDTITLMEHMAFGSESFSLKLSGLTPNSSNTLTLYSYGWEDTGAGRYAFFTGLSGGKMTAVDQDKYGRGTGIIIQYDYIASSDGTFTFVSSPAHSASPGPTAALFLIAGFTSEETGRAAPQLDVETLLDFGEVVPGTSKIMQLKVRNSGGGFVSGTISPTTAPFSLTNYYYATALTSDYIKVEFSPTVEGIFTNNITLTGAGIGGDAEVTILGTGIPEPIGILIINFGFIILFFAYKNKGSL